MNCAKISNFEFYFTTLTMNKLIISPCPKRTIFAAFLILLFLFVSCGKGRQTKLTEGCDTLEVLNELLKRNEKNADLYYQKAQYYLSNDILSEALSNCNKAITLDAQNANYHLLKADILLKSGKANETKVALETVLQLDPKNSSGHLKLAELSLLMKDFKRALEETEKVIATDPNNATAYFIKGFTAKETGDSLTAVQSYQKAIELNSEYEMAFEELGNLYASKNDKLCEEYFSTAIRINPKNIIAMYQLAMYYQDNGRIDEALDLYDNILSLSPENANSLHNIGYIYLVFQDKPKEAAAYFTRAIEASPEFYEAYYNRALAYEKMGNKAEAAKDYKRTLEVNPDFKKAKDALGVK